MLGTSPKNAYEGIVDSSVDSSVAHGLKITNVLGEITPPYVL
jgi:hypothetical protein